MQPTLLCFSVPILLTKCLIGKWNVCLPVWQSSQIHWLPTPLTWLLWVGEGGGREAWERRRSPLHPPIGFLLLNQPPYIERGASLLLGLIEVGLFREILGKSLLQLLVALFQNVGTHCFGLWIPVSFSGKVVPFNSLL